MNEPQYPAPERVLPAGVRISNSRAPDTLGNLQISIVSARYIADHCGSAVETGRNLREDRNGTSTGTDAKAACAREGNDHLVQDVYNPKPPDEKHAAHSPTTSTGLPVEDQVRKEWDSRKGGLPTF